MIFLSLDFPACFAHLALLGAARESQAATQTIGDSFVMLGFSLSAGPRQQAAHLK
jgi:hypothetical protein